MEAPLVGLNHQPALHHLVASGTEGITVLGPFGMRRVGDVHDVVGVVRGHLGETVCRGDNGSHQRRGGIEREGPHLMRMAGV